MCHRITPPGTMPLTVLAMSPLCYSYFSRCHALLRKACLPARLPPSRPPPPRQRRRRQGTVATSFHLGNSRHSWRKNDFAANLHRDRIIVVRVGGREAATDFPHLGRGCRKCQSLLSEGWKETRLNPRVRRGRRGRRDCSEPRRRRSPSVRREWAPYVLWGG